MKKKLKIAGIITGVIVLIAALTTAAALAYGPASSLGVSSSSLAQQMEDNKWGSEGKDKLSDVDCLRKTASTYTCMGTYTPDEDSTSEDLDESLTGPRPMGYEVIVNFGGMWIANPS
jgi:hypothetical protein